MPLSSLPSAAATLADVLAALRPGDYLLLPAAAVPAAPITPLFQLEPMLAGLPPGEYVLLSTEASWEELTQEL